MRFDKSFDKKQLWEMAIRNAGLNNTPKKNIQRIENTRSNIKVNENKITRVPYGRSTSIIKRVEDFTNNDGKIYITFGGVGDLILLLAECYQDKAGNVIFFANTGATEFAKYFLNYFKLKHLISPNLMGSRLANVVVNNAKETGRLANSAHLADGLDYGDYSRNTEKYKNRMVLKTSWLTDIGTIPELLNKPTVVIAPSGSAKTPSRQRYMLVDEYANIVQIYLKNGYTVYTIGSQRDYDYYPKISNTNHNWLMADKIINKNKTIPLLDFSMFLKIINSSNVVVSVDTWLKSYSCLAGIKTRVVETRYNGEYRKNHVDPCDWIFLNTDFWDTMQIHRIDDLVLNNCFCLEDAECK